MFICKMKIYLYSFSIVAFYKLVGCTSKPWQRATLTSVTTFPGLEELFRETTTKNDPLRIEYDADIAIKRGICYYVLSSSYFKMIDEELVDPQLNETRRELNDHYVEIYKEFYGRPRRKRDSFFPNIKKRIYQYANEYKDRWVVISSECIRERVFTCLARVKGTNKIKEYFVSKEYNVNRADPIAWQKEYITGRFVFAYNSTSELVVHALAEEAALMHTAYNDPEALYFSRRQRVKSDETEESNPICKLSIDDKLRTCSAIMSIQEFRSRFKFEPKIENIEAECIERELFFKSERIQQQVLRNNSVHKEWTIGCITEKIEGASEHKIYVSRSYHFNKVFVHSLTPAGRISIGFIGSNIAVVDDNIKLR